MLGCSLCHGRPIGKGPTFAGAERLDVVADVLGAQRTQPYLGTYPKHAAAQNRALPDFDSMQPSMQGTAVLRIIPEYLSLTRLHTAMWNGRLAVYLP